MNFVLNQIFMDTYPPESAQFCNQNGYILKEIGRQEGVRRFQIQETPAPSEAELAEQRRQEILTELDRLDRASSRSLRAILMAQAAGNEPAQADVQMLATHEAEAVALREELQGLQ